MIVYPDVIKAGQNSRLAFLDKADAQTIAETLVAFANSEGGTIIIGLTQEGKISKNKLDSDVLEKVLREAEKLCSPTVVTGNWEEMTLESADEDSPKPPKAPEDQPDSVTEPSPEPQQPLPTHTIYALRIPRSVELHALYDGRVLIRTDIKNRPLGGQEILRLASTKTTGDYETEAVMSVTRADFSTRMIDEYLEKRAERTKRPYSGDLDALLKEIGAIDDDGHPTTAGVLMFCEYPQQWIPQSSVVFAKFVGKTPRGESGLAGYTRREELTGPLPRLIESAWNLIWSEMAVGAVVTGLKREEDYEYPQFAVREAIVNAICHRDYRLKGRRIEIRMYSDRLEVISPGGLPGFITVDNIKDEHFSRNPRLVNGLFQWGYIEELGLGIDRMIEVMQQTGRKPPYFDARPYSFAVTLYNVRQKQSQPDWIRNTNHRQARALEYVQSKGEITNREYRQLCEGVSAETLRLDLVDMVEKGILEKVGTKKGTRYILK
jgi:ATP-dependent DNA helicase RecG